MKPFHNVYDIRQFLMKYNSVIYTRDPQVDLLLMEEELKTMYDLGLLDIKDFYHGRGLLRTELNRLEENQTD